MKKLLLIILFVCTNIFAEWLLFDSPNCPHCERVLLKLKNVTTNKVSIFDLGVPENYKMFLTEAEKRGETNAWPGSLPVLMTGGKIIRGEKNVILFLTGKNYKNENPIKLKMFVIGLIDGINPCAFALMIFVCAALRLAGRKNKELILGALVFVLAVAGTYLLLGWGLMQGMRAIMSSHKIRFIVYFIFGILTFAAAIISFANIYRAGQLAGVPEKWRRNLQRGIRKKFRFGTGLLIIAAAGVAAAGVESVCTGQVYLPALLMLERQAGNTATAILSLFLYNFGFIIPLFLVAVAAVFGLKAAEFERWGIAQKKWASGILFLLFLFFTVVLFMWSASEYRKMKSGGANQKIAEENQYISLSKSNAVNFVEEKIGIREHTPELYKTPTGELFWKFDKYGISVDFWKPKFLTERVDGEKTRAENIFVYEIPKKFKKICNETLMPEYDEYVGAIAWVILYRQKIGDELFNKIPNENLYELISKACAGCGEETGFRLITGRYGLTVGQSTKNVDCNRQKMSIVMITWKESGLNHAAVLLEKRAGEKWLMVRFLEGSEPVFVIGTVGKKCRMWEIKKESK